MSGPLAEKIKQWQADWPADFSVGDISKAGTPILIYGAGKFGQRAQQILTAHGFKIEAFLDQRARELKEVAGVPCHALDDEPAKSLLRTDATVVIGVFNFAVSVNQIGKILVERGAKRVITPLQLLEAFPQELGSQFWMAPRSFYRDKIEQIERVNGIWEDEESRGCYLEALRLRIDHDWSALDEPDSTHQYFPPSLPRWLEPINLVDGGAFTGDTIASFLEGGYALNRVYAFEPDGRNLDALSQRAQNHFPDLELSVWPNGLGAREELLNFAGDAGGASRFGAGEQKVSVIALDGVIQNEPVSLIKLDIEGAEPMALAGMRRTIARCQPGLAVCVYHEPGHLFLIAETLKEWLPRYHFYLRYHQFSGFDTVLYARP